MFAYVIGIYPDKESTNNMSPQDQAILYLMKTGVNRYIKKELPKTLYGKIDYKELEKEEEKSKKKEEKSK